MDFLFNYTIDVVCDSPRHARDKVATIASFGRDKGGDWMLVRGADRSRRWTKRRAQRAAGVQQEVEGVYGDPEPKCKLCGKGLPRLSEGHHVLMPVLNELAAQGKSRITLLELSRVASRTKR